MRFFERLSATSDLGRKHDIIVLDTIHDIAPQFYCQYLEFLPKYMVLLIPWLYVILQIKYVDKF